jgi:hypothetical protein
MDSDCLITSLYTTEASKFKLFPIVGEVKYKQASNWINVSGNIKLWLWYFDQGDILLPINNFIPQGTLKHGRD